MPGDTSGKAVYVLHDLVHKQFTGQGELTGKQTNENKCLCLRLSFAFGQHEQEWI